jgi:predicted glycoside hydrolase/deacetylase ChbG (UPF0249 family)
LKRLVVTADDVGLHPDMTAGAMRAHDQGIVTAVSMCAPGRDLENAAREVLARPELDAGIHLVLVGERPSSPPDRVASLVGRDGKLLPGFRAFGWRYLRGAIDPDEVELELRAQIETVLGHGVRPLHLNSHQHLHVLPRIFAIAARLAVEYGIPWIRLPLDPHLPALAPRGMELRTLGALSRRARRRVVAPLRALEESAGLFDAGHLTAERLLAIIARAEDSTELVCHPGLDGSALAAAYDWNYRWGEETAALCDRRLPGALATAGVSLAGFRDL